MPASERPEMPGLEIEGDPKLVRDLMSRQIITIGPDDTLENTEQYMSSFKFRHLPVVDDGKLVGLITHRDLLHASSSNLSEHAKERDAVIHKQPAKRIMQSELVTVRPDTPLKVAARTMWEKKLGCLPVTEDDGKLVGIITEADFVRLGHKLLS